MRVRIAIGAAGVTLALFGVLRMLTQVPVGDVLVLLAWLLGALLVHDGLLAPAITTLGVLLSKVPARVRRFLQGGLITAGLVTVIAVPMIYRAHSQPQVKAILDQNFAGNLAILLVIVGAGATSLYLWRLLRDHFSTGKERPPDDPASSTV